MNEIDPDLWLGSYVELAIEVSQAADDELLREALGALVREPGLRGVWSDRGSLGGVHDVLDVESATLASGHMGYGVLQLDDVREAVCVIVLVREPEGSDWLLLCLPTGALDRVHAVTYPLARATNTWWADVEGSLEAIGRHVHRAAPFELALIGEEVSGGAHAARVTSAHLSGTTSLLPEALVARLDLETHVRRRVDGLCTVFVPR